MEFGVRVEAGILKNQEGLDYLQEAINKKSSKIELIGFVDGVDDDGAYTEIRVRCPECCFILPVCNFVLKTFNRRKRWIKNK